MTGLLRDSPERRPTVSITATPSGQREGETQPALTHGSMRGFSAWKNSRSAVATSIAPAPASWRLPGTWQLPLFLLLLDERVGSVVLAHHRLPDVRDLSALVKFAAEHCQLVLGRCLKRLDLRRHLRLERHLRQHLVDRHERRD